MRLIHQQIAILARHNFHQGPLMFGFTVSVVMIHRRIRTYFLLVRAFLAFAISESFAWSTCG